MVAELEAKEPAEMQHTQLVDREGLAHVCMAGLLAQSWLSLVAVAGGNQMGAKSQARHFGQRE